MANGCLNVANGTFSKKIFLYRLLTKSLELASDLYYLYRIKFGHLSDNWLRKFNFVSAKSHLKMKRSKYSSLDIDVSNSHIHLPQLWRTEKYCWTSLL